MTEAKEVVKHYQLKPFKEVQEYQTSCTLRIQEQIVQLHYTLKGQLDDLELTDVQSTGERKIGLWERTCFEFFVSVNGKSEYFEFNFSPKGDWNCFHFPTKGKELAEYPRIKRIPISANQDITQDISEFHLTALINLNQLGEYFYVPDQMSANLACVILHPQTGVRDYWALDHLLSKPNFHDFNTFNASF